VYFRILFVLNRVRLSHPQHLTSPRSNPQNQIKSVASPASDRNSNQFQTTLILWFKCNKKKQLPILIINHVHVQKLTTIYYARFNFAHSSISINLPITCQFFIIIKSTITHFFFLTGARDMGNYIFFPCPFSAPSPIASNSPFCFAGHCPLRAYFFFQIIAIFYWNSQ